MPYNGVRQNSKMPFRADFGDDSDDDDDDDDDDFEGAAPARNEAK